MPKQIDLSTLHEKTIVNAFNDKGTLVIECSDNITLRVTADADVNWREETVTNTLHAQIIIPTIHHIEL